MPSPTPDELRAVETAVTQLLETCRKDGPLYPQHPKTVAQVNRTSKWLLRALAALRHDLDPACDQPAQPPQ